jgi:hypothetical protein
VSANAAGYVVGPGEGVTGGDPDVKATAASTGGALTVMESVISQGPPRHFRMASFAGSDRGCSPVSTAINALRELLVVREI